MISQGQLLSHLIRNRSVMRPVAQIALDQLRSMSFSERRVVSSRVYELKNYFDSKGEKLGYVSVWEVFVACVLRRAASDEEYDALYMLNTEIILEDIAPDERDSGLDGREFIAPGNDDFLAENG